ncbi:flagellar motor protein MotB [Candidatus Liberibacter brunswickensis]|uniref:flagellar motor protein MotB n=1 Tax=Candidatus Liberibacter brunswickensis TaxID=1968796 RepID=UPI002FE36764
MNYNENLNNKNEQFIFIKKKVDKNDSKHSLGSWKIVYADFMTVLMSFFLLMWIINATDDNTKREIEEYFNPFGKNLQIAPKGIFNEEESIKNFPQINNDLSINLGTKDNFDDNIFYLSNPQKSDSNQDLFVPYLEQRKVVSNNKSQEKAIKIEENYFLPPLDKKMILEMKRKKRSQELKKRVSSKLLGLVSDNVKKGVIFDTTNNGTLISIIDQHNNPMFDKSSHIPLPETVLIIQKIGEVLSNSNEKISIRGHTDASLFHDFKRDNWKLSLDRAYSAYKILMKSGISEDRILNISGFAHHSLKIVSDPMNAANRRIDILVKDVQG